MVVPAPAAAVSGRMSSSVGLHTQLAAVMESLVHAAVAELSRLVEGSSFPRLSLQVRTGSSGSKTGEEPPEPAKEQNEGREKMVRSGGRESWSPAVFISAVNCDYSFISNVQIVFSFSCGQLTLDH